MVVYFQFSLLNVLCVYWNEGFCTLQGINETLWVAILFDLCVCVI